MNHTDLFEDIVTLPDPRGLDQFNRLVGLDEYKSRLVKEALLGLDPGQLNAWSAKHYGGKLAALESFSARPPLFVLAGDVGTGKTTGSQLRE